MLALFGIAVGCFIKAKNNEKSRIVHFTPKTQEKAKREFRNGVEVKPSELGKESKNTAINDSRVENDESCEMEE
jgi:hypothetical protein